mmetsp:Transcript_4462/g.9738  ORF Transcript_4462/g.9738 Transcript_4462/m.9738 type:complete len:90 (+) Transcript_4462:3-272(+)
MIEIPINLYGFWCCLMISLNSKVPKLWNFSLATSSTRAPTQSLVVQSVPFVMTMSMPIVFFALIKAGEKRHRDELRQRQARSLRKEVKR